MTATALPLGLEPEFTAAEVAQSFCKSERWLKKRIIAEGIEHTRHGGPNGKITFTVAQVEKLRALDKVTPVAEPIPTGRAKRPPAAP